MLIGITMEAKTGESFDFVLGDYQSGYSILDITGLGPVKASIASEGYGAVDGDRYLNSRIGVRDISMDMEFVPNYISTSVDSLRNRIYSAFAPKDKIKIWFHSTDAHDKSIEAVIEQMDVVYFTQQPMVAWSFFCPDPYFLGDEHVIALKAGVPTKFMNEGNVDGGYKLAFNAKAGDTFTIDTPYLQRTIAFAKAGPTEISTVKRDIYFNVNGYSAISTIEDNILQDQLRYGEVTLTCSSDATFRYQERYNAIT